MNCQNRMVLHLFILSATIWLECGSAPSSPPTSIGTTPLEYTVTKSFTPGKVPEPSGVVFVANRGTLFIVGDRGDIGEFTLAGALLNHRNIEQADFEGITCNPASGLLYAVVEGKGKILEINPSNLQVTREFVIDWIFHDHLVLEPKTESIEAITLAPDSLDTNGGTFFLANKSIVLQDAKKLSIIMELAIPLASADIPTAAARIINTISPSIPGMSDLYFDAASNTLFVMSNSSNLMYQMNRTGQISQSFKLPGDQQEGMTAISDSSFVITDDAGPVFIISYARRD